MMQVAFWLLPASALLTFWQTCPIDWLIFKPAWLIDCSSNLFGKPAWLIDWFLNLFGKPARLFDWSLNLLGKPAWLIDWLSNLFGKPAWLIDWFSKLFGKPAWLIVLLKHFLANTIEFYWHEPLPSSTYVTLWYFHIWETAQYLTQGLDKESQLALFKLSDKSAGLCFLNFSGISLCTFSTVNFWAIAEYIFGKPARLCFLTFQQSILLFLIVNSVLIFHFSTNTEYKFGKPAGLCF